MSSNRPAYMQTEWFNGLLREISASTVTGVAARIGVSRVTLSIFVHGKGLYGSGVAKPDNIELRYRRTFEQLTCPHNGKQVGATHCRDTALRAAPTHNPMQMMQWQACQQCQWKPVEIVANPNKPDAGSKRSDETQQAGVIDIVTLPLPEIGGPQISEGAVQ